MSTRDSLFLRGFRHLLGPSRDEAKRMWDTGEPVHVVSSRFERDFDVWWHRHSTFCAVNATGHRGPCTCGGDRV